MNQSILSSTTKKLLGLAGLLFFSASAFAATIAPPPPPKLVYPAPTGNPTVPQKSVNFQWAPQGGSYYYIVISQNQAFSGLKWVNNMWQCDGTCYSLKTNSTSYGKDMSLAGAQYYWKAIAFNAANVSGSWSPVSLFKTAAAPVNPLFAKVDAFVAKWNGKGVDFDGRYGFQCVDLAHQYAQEVLNLNSYLATGNAYPVYVNTNSSKFTKIPNTPTAVPQKGDIIFWKPSASDKDKAGHVAIFISGNATTFTSFDQNWSTKASPSVLPKLVNHSYLELGGVAGWLHPNL